MHFSSRRFQMGNVRSPGVSAAQINLPGFAQAFDPSFPQS